MSAAAGFSDFAGDRMKPLSAVEGIKGLAMFVNNRTHKDAELQTEINTCLLAPYTLSLADCMRGRLLILILCRQATQCHRLLPSSNTDDDRCSPKTAIHGPAKHLVH